MNFFTSLIVIVTITLIIFWTSRLSLRVVEKTRNSDKFIKIKALSKATGDDLKKVLSVDAEEEKRRAIAKKLLNFWGVSLTQGAMSINITALLVFIFQTDKVILLPLESFKIDDGIFLYVFLLILQLGSFIWLTGWRYNYMLDMLNLTVEEIEESIFKRENMKSWKKDGKIFAALFIGALMLWGSIALISSFVANG